MANVNTACAVCVTIFVLVVNSNWFQILLSYTLLLKPPVLMHTWLTIKKARPTLSTGNVVGGTLLSANVLKKRLQCMDSVSRQITTVNHTQKQGIITGTLPYRYSCSYIHGISTRDVHKLRCVHRVYTDWVVPHAKLIHCWTTVHTHLVKKDQPLYQKAFAVSPILRPRVHKNRQPE